EPLTGGHAAWLRMPRETLLEVAALPMRSDRVVLQVRPGDGADDELLIDLLRPLARRGTAIAVDGFAWRPGIEPLLDLAWAVKLDVAEHGLEGLAAQVEALAGRELLLVATSVATHADLEACRALGIQAFQGSFLAEPDIVPGRAAPTQSLEALGSVADLHSSVEFEDLEAAIVRDVGMSHKLLRYANSA
ncbi:MAG: hypothetical protein M3141_09705, partial [Actinomycetota bacterium]|nr:hypothetical protein [Actinomycetota bacterium]